LGVKERHEREREAVARGILDAARELFVAEGYQNVSLRRIAERIEYSPAAIYGYFPSKDDIFLALAEEGFHLLFDHYNESVPVNDALDGIRRAVLNLYEFSKSHPEYYHLMFLDRSVPRVSRNWQRFGFVREMKGRVATLIGRAIEDGAIAKGNEPDTVFRVLVAAVHGPAVMRLCDRLNPGESADALAHDALEVALAGLRTGVPLTFRADPCVAPPESDR
jgi:AcrR family transcriptional regulator